MPKNDTAEPVDETGETPEALLGVNTPEEQVEDSSPDSSNGEAITTASGDEPAEGPEEPSEEPVDNEPRPGVIEKFSPFGAVKKLPVLDPQLADEDGNPGAQPDE
jgi:hypothetical protein